MGLWNGLGIGYWDLGLRIGSGDWNWGLRFRIGIWDFILKLWIGVGIRIGFRIMIGVWDCRWDFGICVPVWGLGMRDKDCGSRSRIPIGDFDEGFGLEDWRLAIWD